jgi:hypothetical protein
MPPASLTAHRCDRSYWPWRLSNDTSVACASGAGNASSASSAAWSSPSPTPPHSAAKRPTKRTAARSTADPQARPSRPRRPARQPDRDRPEARAPRPHASEIACASARSRRRRTTGYDGTMSNACSHRGRSRGRCARAIRFRHDLRRLSPLAIPGDQHGARANASTDQARRRAVSALAARPRIVQAGGALIAVHAGGGRRGPPPGGAGDVRQRSAERCAVGGRVVERKVKPASAGAVGSLKTADDRDDAAIRQLLQPRSSQRLGARFEVDR